jgi:hypothetical protein
VRRSAVTALIALIATVLIAIAVPAQAATNPTPRRAARAAKACFVNHGWWARLADRGKTVNAKAPRKLKGYPYRPWYSVTFNEGPHYVGTRGKTYAITLMMKLNSRERRLAGFCARAAWR